jgi:hypothetical protein
MSLKRDFWVNWGPRQLEFLYFQFKDEVQRSKDRRWKNMTRTQLGIKGQSRGQTWTLDDPLPKHQSSWAHGLLWTHFMNIDILETRICRIVKWTIQWDVWVHFLHFGGLEMPFLPSRETHCWKVISVVSAHFLHCGGLKMPFSSESWNPRFKGTLLGVSSFSALWRTENAISDKSCNPWLKNT